MTDSHHIILYAGLAAAATYYLFTRPPTQIRTNFYNPGKDILVYDPTLVISAYDYRTNKYAKNAFWLNQYERKDERYSAPPE